MTLCVFFFQAEDGIRDGHVTGVQTCALPISAAGRSSRRCVARPRPAVHCSPPAELRTARPPPSPTPRRRPCLPGVVAQGRVDALGPMQQQRQGKGPYDLLDGPPTSTTRQGELSASHECSEGPAPTRLSGQGPGAPLRITVTG